MNVNFYATLREAAGRKTVELELGDEVTVRALLDAVVERFPPMKHALFDAGGRLYPHVHVFVNGRDAPYLEEGLETRVHATDSVDLFPAIGGG